MKIKRGSISKKGKSFQAAIRNNGERIYLGAFKFKRDAQVAVDKFIRKNRIKTA